MVGIKAAIRRLIPARAGNAAECQVRPNDPAVDPRACGERFGFIGANGPTYG